MAGQDSKASSSSDGSVPLCPGPWFRSRDGERPQSRRGRRGLGQRGRGARPGPGAALRRQHVLPSRAPAGRASEGEKRGITEGRARRRQGTGGKGRRRPGTLTLPQPVLEIGVAPPLAVEVDAVSDEERPAEPRGDGAGPAHHHGAAAAPAPLPPRGPRRAPQAPWGERAQGKDPSSLPLTSSARGGTGRLPRCLRRGQGACADGRAWPDGAKRREGPGNGIPAKSPGMVASSL